jgi:hypothetical protein
VITGGIVPSDQLAPNCRHPLALLSVDERNTALGEVIVKLAIVDELYSDKTQENRGDLECQPSPCALEPMSE